MDTHQGVSGTYTIRGCTLGHAGLNAIGRGTLTVENSTLNGRSLISLRGDYGSTWEGTVIIRNSRWIPACGAPVQPYLLRREQRRPARLRYLASCRGKSPIDGLVIDDTKHPKDYKAVSLRRPGRRREIHRPPVRPLPADRASLTICNLTTASGQKPQTSPNPAFNAKVRVIEAN